MIGFHGELSPWLNFHLSPFQLEGKKFLTPEHLIQYLKAKLFEDNTVADAILNCDSALEAKWLGHKVSREGMKLWHEEGYNICFKGVKAKFDQNSELLQMLKTTAPRVLVESSNNKTWGTGVPLRDTHGMSCDKWHSPGWLSSMLECIWDTNQNYLNEPSQWLDQH